MIKTDPGSTKTVVVLIVILLGAVAVTFARIVPGKGSSAGASTPAVAAAKGAGSVAVLPISGLARNPFRNPDGTGGQSAKAPSGIGIIAQSEQMNQDAKLEPLQIGVLPVGSSGETSVEESPNAAESTDEKPAPPEFVLLATVEGPQGISAVIRSGTSAAVVVTSGEVVEGGYKVQHIDKSRAVLKNGVDTVVVKRPE